MNVQQYWNAPFANKKNARRKNEMFQEEELYAHQKRTYSILGPLFCTRRAHDSVVWTTDMIGPSVETALKSWPFLMQSCP